MSKLKYLILTIIVICQSVLTIAQNKKKQYQKIEHDKAVYVETFLNNTKLSTGTGFFIIYKKSSYFLTNYHVVTGIDAGTNKIKDIDQRLPNRVRLKLIDKAGKVLTLDTPVKSDWQSSVILNNLHIDVAVIKLPVPNQCDAKSYYNKLSTDSLKNGDECYEIGFPKDYLTKNELFKGLRTNAKLLLTIKTKPKEACAYAHTSELQAGSSGSPVFNSKGDVIGIHFGAMPNHKGSFFVTNEGIINCIEKATKI